MNTLIWKKRLIILLILWISVLINNTILAGPPIRSKIRPLQNAIGKNLRQALKPTFTIQSRYAGAMTSVAFSRDGKFFVTGSANSSAQIWNPVTGQREMNLPCGSPVTTVAFVGGSRFLAVGTQKAGVSLWNLETGEQIRSFGNHSGQIYSMAASPDGYFLMIASDDSVINIWDVEKGSLSRKLEKGHKSAVLSLAMNQDGTRLVSGGKDKRIQIWDWQTGSLIMTLRGKDKVNSLAISRNDRYLAAGLGNGRIQVWNFTTGSEILYQKVHGGSVQDVSFSTDGELLAISGTDKSACILRLSDGELKCYTDHQGAVNAVCFTPDGRYLITAGNDRMARFWERDSDKEIARLISMKSGWAVVSPEGYFDGTLDGEEEDRLNAVRWAGDGWSFGMDRFLEGYYKPALLGRQLAGNKIEKPKTLPDIPDITETGFKHPPTVNIIKPKPDSQIQQQMIPVTVEVTDEGDGINEIRLSHNGKVIYTKAAIKDNKKTYEIALIDGENNFRAVGFSDERIEGKPHEISVFYKASEPPKPDLHVVAVGISQYSNSDMNLNFGVTDAKGILGFFIISYGGIFDELKKYELFDHNATRASIYEVLESLKNIPPQDTVIIYLAGHGETFEDDWYYIPYELPGREGKVIQEGGVPSSEFRDYIKQIPARQIFLLMDACKSGAALDIFDDKRSFTLLSHDTGVHVAASATKEQNAIELKSLGHGIFTYVLLQGLKGDADQDSDGNISVQEILSYVQREVPIFVKKNRIPVQTPIAKSGGRDFTVAVWEKGVAK